MVGNQGTLYSGLWLIDHSGGTTRGATGLVSSATLRFANDITPEDIEAYVQTGEPLSVAGAFTLDGRAAAFIESIEGDPLAVVGLSAYALRTMVQELGHRYTELWT
jgi:septum formation protein